MGGWYGLRDSGPSAMICYSAIARGLLVACLLVTAVLKWFGTPADAVVGVGVAKAIAFAEVCIAFGLISRFRRFSEASVVVIALIGGGIALYHAAPCGCTGALHLSRIEHFCLSMTIGFLACVSALGSAGHRLSLGSNSQTARPAP